jgi:hypothetical protein
MFFTGDLNKHLSMKEGSLFCFVVMRSTKQGMLQIVFLVSLESS